MSLANERKLISTAMFILKISFLRQILKARAKKMISIHSLGANIKNSNHPLYIKQV